MQNPFDSIESAYEYVSLLRQQVQDVERGLLEDLAAAQHEGAARRLDALRLVDYKLKQLTGHLTASCRILNDLRAIRRLLMGERDGARAVREVV